MSSDVTLLVENVSYFDILKNVTFGWQKGQMVGLVGPNGAGKSTLLRILAGVYRPTKGDIHVSHERISNMSPKERARQIAYLPQQITETASFTVEQYVEMGRFAYRTLLGDLDFESKLAVKQAMSTFHLLPLRSTRLDHLSGGERQRAGVARCLAQGSPIILLDEPIANLDVHYQLDILDHLQRLVQKGHLVVMAIHHLELAARYCDRLLLLSSGQVYAEGNPTDVLCEEALQEVFQVKARTYRDPFGGYLRISYSS